jgi:hypothetical protein
MIDIDTLKRPGYSGSNITRRNRTIVECRLARDSRLYIDNFILCIDISRLLVKYSYLTQSENDDY